MDSAPLIVHVIHRLHVGGLENGLVNLINRLPPERYRHTVVSMTDITDFSKRIRRPDVVCHALHKKPGKDPFVYFKLWRLFRKWRPAIVHTRNVNTLEAQLPAWLAGVPGRIHGEHGRSMEDLHGENKKYLLLRRLFRRWVRRYVALSLDLKQWMLARVGIEPNRLVQIYNGVDTERFIPQRQTARSNLPPRMQNGFIFGTVGRLRPEKDQANLVRAFVRLIERVPHYRGKAFLVIIGDGEQQANLERMLAQAGLRDSAWLPGNRDDVWQLLPGFDLFVLPSLGEGISNTLLEAMACGVPVLATSVGGNGELIVQGETGTLVPAADSAALSMAMQNYLEHPQRARQHGAAGRRRVEQHFSIDAMVSAYQKLYDDMLVSDT